MNALSLKNVSKRYRANKLALDNVTFTVQKGSFFGLLGLNGAGKSTLIRILSTLIQPTSGTISLFELPNMFQAAHLAREKLGIVPQEINLPIFESVEETLQMSIYAYGIQFEVGQQRIELLLNALDLMKARKSSIGALSGGMKRKVMLARALLSNPELLILDEPTTGLDIEARQNVWELLRTLNRQGMTVLLTSHYLEEIEILCSDLALLHRGQLIFCEPIAQLLQETTQPEEWKLSCTQWPPTEAVELQLKPDERIGADHALYIRSRSEDSAVIFARALELQAAGFRIEGIEKVNMTLEKLLLNLNQSVQTSSN